VTTGLRFALAGAIAAGLGAIVATIWIGARVREETVVARPYEEGLRHTVCDAGAGPCTRPLDGGGEATLELGPRPLRTMRELAVRALVRLPAQATTASRDVRVTVSFSMEGMEMGENRSVLAPAGDGSFAGTAVLVRCPSGRRDWSAELRVEPPGKAPRVARFRLSVAE
jgi:hypothetical protein